MAMDDDNSESESVKLIEDDYYAFLNVTKNATNEEINEAYRRLSRMYHPDKHPNPEDKKKAEALFHKTKRAYEVLSDPRQRAIYDCVGTKGLETEGWELVQRTRSPNEIREEFERLNRIREQQRLEQRTNPKVNFNVNVNATDLFPVYDSEYDDFDFEEEALSTVEISGVSCFGSVDAPLSARDTATVSGNVTSHNGTGSGTVNIGLRRVVSDKGWVECSAGAGNGPSFSIKAFRTLSKRLFGTTICMLHSTPSGIHPGFVGSLGWQLDKGTVGDITWRAGMQSSMSTTISSNDSSSHKSLTLLLGVPHSYISLSYGRRIYDTDDALKLRFTVKAGTFGGVLEYGAEKILSKQSTITAAVMVGVPTGVTLKLKLHRGNQTYNFPILLCEEVMPSPILYATVTPIVVWALLSKFIIEPYQREVKNKNKEMQREANKTRLVEMRKEAQAAKELMAAMFARVRAEEESRRGLVVVRGLYGRLTPELPTAEALDHPEAEIIDVTVQLQVLVKDSKLFLHEASKSQLPGFYDPCVGEEKSLLVQYLFHNHLHQVTILDTEPLRLPKGSLASPVISPSRLEVLLSLALHL